MRILVLAVCLSGCGSACSSSLESAPEPASAAEATRAEPAADQAQAAEPSSEAKPEPKAEPAPPPEPVDPDDERVVYANDGVRTKVRFAASDTLLLVADLPEGGEPGERVSLQDAFGRVRWSHDYGRVDAVALDAQGAYATADGHLYQYDLESGEPTDLAEMSGQLVLTADHVYVHHLGLVKRVPREGGAAKKVVHNDRPGFHTIDVEGEKLAMLASAFRNRPARFPKLGALLVAPAKGGTLRERFTSMYSPGPLLHLDGGYAYFGASDKGEDAFDYRVVRVPLKGPAKPEVVVRHPIAVFDVEGERVFAAARLDERAGLFAFSTGDADPVLMSAFEGGATAVQLSDSYVYWESRGRIYRVEKGAAVVEPEESAEAAEEVEEVEEPAGGKAAGGKAAGGKAAGGKAAGGKAAGGKPAGGKPATGG